jgi:hypothetical protein
MSIRLFMRSLNTVRSWSSGSGGSVGVSVGSSVAVAVAVSLVVGVALPAGVAVVLWAVGAVPVVVGVPPVPFPPHPDRPLRPNALAIRSKRRLFMPTDSSSAASSRGMPVGFAREK